MRREERGAIALIAAIAMTMLTAATALSFDIGREVDTNRTVQAVADAVALDAANFADGDPAAASYQPLAEFKNYSVAQVIQYEASLSAIRNGVSAADLPNDSVTMGSCSATSGCGFVPVETCPLTASAPADAPSCSIIDASKVHTAGITAVKVTASQVTSFVFQAGSATSTRSATAMRTYAGGPPAPPPPPTKVPESVFSLGTTLADVNLGNSIIGPLLAGSLGITGNVSVLTYTGLAGATVSLGQIVAANAQVGTLTQLLDANVSPQTLVGYMVNALQAQGTSSGSLAASQLAPLVSTIGTLPTAPWLQNNIQPCQLVDMNGSDLCGASGSAVTAASNAQVNVLNFLMATAELANGKHAIGINIGGVLGVLNVSLTAVSPMITVGPGPADTPSCPTGYSKPICPLTAITNQLTAHVSITNLSVPPVATVNLGIDVTAASTTATLTQLSCGTSPSTESASIYVDNTDPATLNTTVTGSLVGGPVPINASTGTVDLLQSQPQTLTFTGPFGPGTPAPQQTSGDPAGIVTVTAPSGLTGAVLGPLTTIIDTALNPILGPLLSTLGVNVGIATVIDDDVNCDNTVLVSG